MGQPAETHSSLGHLHPLEQGVEGASRNAFVRLIDLAIPDEMKAEPDVLRRARVVLGFTLALLVLGLEVVAFCAWAIPGTAWERVGAALGVALGMAACIPAAFRSWKSLALGANLMIAGSWLVIVTSFTVVGGIRAPFLHWCALMPMLAVLMGARRSALVWALAGLGTVGAFAMLDSMGVRVGDQAGLAEISGLTLWVERFIDVGSWLVIILSVGFIYEAQRR